MRVASFNVLADAYTGYGNYSHVDPNLLKPGARIGHLVGLINDLGADIIGLQEAEPRLVEQFDTDTTWQAFWLPKKRNKPDGCLTLVRDGIEVSDYKAYSYDDESGHIFQITQIGQVAIANTHIKWAPIDDPNHIGVSQTKELLSALEDYERAIVLADCNDQPGGPVRELILKAGFANASEYQPTAIVNQKLVALDLLATRGVSYQLRLTDIDLTTIPNKDCASDHIPIIADCDI